MNKTFRNFSLILCAIIILVAITLLGVDRLVVKAYDGIAALTEKQLYNETNTYNVTEGLFNTSGNIITEVDGNRINNTTQYNVSYNLGQKNDNKVTESAQITVLTHGLGSNAGTWSNNYSKTNNSSAFAYDGQSLISRISEQVGGAKIYWAKMSGYKSFNLYDITAQKSTGTTYTPTNVVNQINDISKHIVIVFDLNKSVESNNNVYYQFNYMLSKIIYDVKVANGGILPKVNLIGHSRGGITNLQYALDHPDLVSTLVSLARRISVLRQQDFLAKLL
ncbi:MAG: hypothetical protein SOX77_02215 [Candidatus Borkfalkiaceae bacterium]|nr:hypothetical protein [Christensenellaceae bacterium]